MTLSKLELRQRELIVLFGLICFTTPVFWLTNLDWQAAALFYSAGKTGNPWPWRDWWLWDALYRYAPLISASILVGALLVVLLSFVLSSLLAWRKPALYIVMVIALGPGLVVNLVFKDHWGRPRPVHINGFGGQYAYVPPLLKGHTDDKSFPCGHCTIGYMFFALYFLSRKRKRFYLTLSLVFAVMMALARMSAGGHFVSDVLWSGYLVFFVAWMLYYGWYVRQFN